MGGIARVLCAVGLWSALAWAAQAAAQADPANGKPDPTSPVSAQGQHISESARAQLLQVRTLLKDQDSQASVGSGFVVDASGLVITNFHVVSQFALQPERYRLAFRMAQGRSGTAELLAIDVVHDLALLRLRSSDSAAT